MFEKIRLHRSIRRAYDEGLRLSDRYARSKSKKNWAYRELVQNKPGAQEKFSAELKIQFELLEWVQNVLPKTTPGSPIAIQLDKITSELDQLKQVLESQKKLIGQNTGNSIAPSLNKLLREETEIMKRIPDQIYSKTAYFRQMMDSIKTNEYRLDFCVQWLAALVICMAIAQNRNWKDFEDVMRGIIASGLITAFLHRRKLNKLHIFG